MKKLLGGSLIVLFFTSVLCADATLAIDEVIKKIDPSKYTKVQLKEYAQEIKGKQAEGSGTVANVKAGRNKYKITILTSASSPEKGYNVVLITSKNALELNIGDKISFKGELGRISSFRGGSVDIAGDYTKL